MWFEELETLQRSRIQIGRENGSTLEGHLHVAGLHSPSRFFKVAAGTFDFVVSARISQVC